MTISTLAFGKASAAGSHSLFKHAARFYSAPSPSAPGGTGPTPANKPIDAANQRELFVNVLNANATKRDAKQYLARFNDPKLQQPTAAAAHHPSRHESKHPEPVNRAGVNLGGLYSPGRAIAENPQFLRQAPDHAPAVRSESAVHVALVAFRSPQTVDEATLDGVALTLSQLVKLDMRIVLVLDCIDSPVDLAGSAPDVRKLSKIFTEQAARLDAAISRHSAGGARTVNGAVEIMTREHSTHPTSHDVMIASPNMLLQPLKRSAIPVVPPLAYTSHGRIVQCSASIIMPALARFLSVSPTHLPPAETADRPSTSVDRIIVLDNIGGIPSKARGDDAHLFINLEQEFHSVAEGLSEYERSTPLPSHSSDEGLPSVFAQHLSNLQMVQDCLSHLPAASSALIISPEEAASSSQIGESAESPIGTGTRRQKNTLIHNLLTNKPTVSPSLPVARIPSTAPAGGDLSVARQAPRSTLVKRGMPLAIIPGVSRGQGWSRPPTGRTTLDFAADARVDLPRLLHLINDSFRRQLNLEHYLARIEGRVAGLIVAGSYEGGAILTWEQPPGTSDPARLVPYLDKFAVLSSSQGSAGVADVLFQAMVHTCFPRGVCWRSRKDNPVNKWYFERADGHWQIPGTNWTMFWTGEGIAENRERWEDYVGVCTTVEASWMDGKRPD